MTRGRNFFGQSLFFKRAFSVTFALFLVLGALAFVGCPTANDPFIDNNKLNTGLIGDWQASGSGSYVDNDTGETVNYEYTDTYAITGNTDNEKRLGTISHPDGMPSYDANIVFVYNFSETSGCLIIKFTDSTNNGKYDAVYFKDLSSGSVLLGDAYDTTKDYLTESTDSSVATLEEALLRFHPENAATYGGGSAQSGTPQSKQP